MSTDLENFKATTNHEPPDRILYYGDFTEDLRRRVIEHIGTTDFERHYHMADTLYIPIRRPANLPALDFRTYWEDEDLPEGTIINDIGVAEVPSGYYHFFGYVSPLRNAQSLSEIENYPMDDLSGWDFSYMKSLVDQAHQEGRIAKGWVGHMYEKSWQIRGMEQFLMDMMQQPSWAECLLDRFAHSNLIKAKAYAEAGVDWITCGDDVATQVSMMFSTELWREMMLSRWKKIWTSVKEINPDAKIWYHSDGNITSIIPELLDAGVDILNPVQPECVDLDEIHRKYGKRLVMDGTIGTQTTMPFGTAEEVAARVKTVIYSYGRNGGLIISPTHILEPEVPLKNIDTFFNTCYEYGKRDATR